MAKAEKTNATADRQVRKSTERLAQTAKTLEHSTERVEGSADRRTELAADRTVFAAERTYAAWVRTGLVALASGVGAKQLLAGLMPEWMVLATGTVLVLFSAFCFVAGVWRNLNPGPPPPRPEVPHLPPWLLVVINGFLALVAFTALVGIWFGGGAS